MMVITNDFLLGLLLGIVVAVGVTQLLKLGNRMMRPGCLVVIGLCLVAFVALVLTGVIDFQVLR